MLRTPAFYFMWVAYALGCSAGLMVISQLVPFAKSVGIPSAALATMGLVVGAVGNASGRILSGWMSDHTRPTERATTDDRHLHDCHAHSVPVGGNVALLYVTVFVVYWCYGTQLSVNGSTAADFWGTKNAGINYGMLFTAWGVAGMHRPPHRRRAVRQVQELPDGVLHGGGAGGELPCSANWQPSVRACRQEGCARKAKRGRAFGKRVALSSVFIEGLLGTASWRGICTSCGVAKSTKQQEFTIRGNLIWLIFVRNNMR